MANPKRGEVELVVGDDEKARRLTLFLSTNAVCVLQRKTGKTYGQILGGIKDLDFVALRDLVHMLLQKYHAKEFPNPEVVGDLIDEAGGLATMIEVLTEIFTLNAPAAKDQAAAQAAAAERSADPNAETTATGGTGTSSTLTAVA